MFDITNMKSSEQRKAWDDVTKINVDAVVYDEQDEKNEDGSDDDNVTNNDDLMMLYVFSSDEEGSHSGVDELSSPTGSDTTSSKQSDFWKLIYSY